MTTVQMLATQDKAKPHTENIRGLNLVTVRHTVVQVTKLPLQHRLEGQRIICFTKPGLTTGLVQSVYLYKILYKICEYFHNIRGCTQKFPD